MILCRHVENYDRGASDMAESAGVEYTCAGALMDLHKP